MWYEHDGKRVFWGLFYIRYLVGHYSLQKVAKGRSFSVFQKFLVISVYYLIVVRAPVNGGLEMGPELNHQQKMKTKPCR